jgi:lactose/L-arabinose transport system substrate-binding protein
MKRFLLGVMILVLTCTFAFAGAGQQKASPQPADPNAPKMLNIWTWDPATAVLTMQEAAKTYMKSHPNVTVTVVETPWDDVQSKLITAFSSGQTGSLPDITSMQDNAAQKNIINFSEGFMAFDDYIDLSQFIEFKLEVAKYNGKHYGIPLDNGVTASFYRRDIIEQAGLNLSDFNDITWERFIELGKIVKAKTGLPMISATTNSSDMLSMMLQSCGTYYFDRNGKAYIQNNPIIRRGMELIKEMVDSGILLLVPDWNSYIATLNKGTVAGTIQGCWILGSIKLEPSQSGKWGMVNTPKLSAFNSVNYSNQGGSCWMVLSNAKYPEVAMDFLKTLFADVGPILDFQLTTGLVPCWKPAGQTALMNEAQPFFGGQKLFAQLMEYGSKVPPIQHGIYNIEARDAAARALSEYLQGSRLDDVLAAAQKNTDFQMGN